MSINYIFYINIVQGPYLFIFFIKSYLKRFFHDILILELYLEDYMSISNFEMNFMKYLQESGVTNLFNEENRLFKTINTLKRNINNINTHLPLDKQFIVEGTIVISQIDYKYYLEFLGSLSLNDYSHVPKERINLLIIKGFFCDFFNKSEIYTNINVSLTTLKKDTLDLKKILKLHQLDLVNIPKKGVKIVGDELNYRLLTVSILLNLIDLENNGTIYSKKSNSPLERVFTEIVITNLKDYISEANLLLNTLLESLHLKLSYTSKKFLILYLSLTLFRLDKKHEIELDRHFQFSTFNTSILPTKNENFIFNYIFISLDFIDEKTIFYNEQLEQLTHTFLKSIQNKIITKILFEKEIFHEVYNFLYKSIIRNKLNYQLYDDKLENTEKFLKNLYSITTESLKNIESIFNISFSNFQIGSLTIILKKYITKSKIVGRNKRRIIIVSNSSSEKIDFFIERLKIYVEFDLIKIISIDNLKILQTLDFDNLITFSNRIKLLLKEMDMESIKLSFHLDFKDIEKLINNGFSRTNRKILANELSEKLENKTKEEIEKILKDNFSEYFV